MVHCCQLPSIVVYLIIQRFLRQYNLAGFDEEVKWSEDNISSAFVGYYAYNLLLFKGEEDYISIMKMWNNYDQDIVKVRGMFIEP